MVPFQQVSESSTVVTANDDNFAANCLRRFAALVTGRAVGRAVAEGGVGARQC